MSRRGNGEGSIYRRAADGRWVAAITWPTGRRQKWYAKSRTEAAAKLAEAVRAQGIDKSGAGMRMRTDAFLAQWLEATKPSLRFRGWQRYEELVRLHILPALGHIPLARLGPADLQRCYAMATTKRSSPRTVLQIHRVIHTALVQALRWELVVRNVSELVDPSRTEKYEPQTLEADQVRRLFAAAAGSRFEALWVLAATTGMRQGQLLALRWRDIDLAKGALAVTGNLQRLPGEGLTILEAKTARSRHQVLIGPLAVATLQAHRDRQAAARLRAADTWEDRDLVFATAIGRPVDAHEVRPIFYRLLAATGLPRVRFHDLRHPAATLLLGEGIHPKIVSEMLGHSTVAITLDTYSHVTAAMHRSAADTLDALLRPQPTEGPP